MSFQFKFFQLIFYFFLAVVSKSERNPLTGEAMSQVLAHLSKGKSFGVIFLLKSSKQLSLFIIINS